MAIAMREKAGADLTRISVWQEAPAPVDTNLWTALSEEDGATIVSLRGELDMATAPVARRALDLAIRAGSPVVVIDLRHLTFADGRGVGEFVRAWRRMELEGRRLSLRAASSPVHRVLCLTRVDRLVPLQAPSAVVADGSTASGRRDPAENI